MSPKKKIRFLHLSTGDTRGAYSGAYRLHQNLIALGHDSIMLVGQKETCDQTVFAPPRIVQRLRRGLEKLQNLAAKIILGKNEQLARIFKSNLPLVPLFHFRNITSLGEVDLVIVHYTADFLSSSQIAYVAKVMKSPLALYLMDMGPLTGSCHYAWECQGYYSGCSECPKLGQKILQELVRNAWEEKKSLYQEHVRVVVYGSEQLAKQARNSSLTTGIPKCKILMGIDPQIYTPEARCGARQYFGFADHELVIYFGAQNVADRRKGIGYLLQAFRMLPTILTPDEISCIRLFGVGDGVDTLDLPEVFSVKRIGYIEEPSCFRMTYAAADLFVCPSVEDSGPMMVNEAIMSGTPTLAFDCGVALDLVVDSETGFRCELKNSWQMAERLVRFVRMTAIERKTMSENCRKRGLRLSSASGQAAAFVALAEQSKL